ARLAAAQVAQRETGCTSQHAPSENQIRKLLLGPTENTRACERLLPAIRLLRDFSSLGGNDGSRGSYAQPRRNGGNSGLQNIHCQDAGFFTQGASRRLTGACYCRPTRRREAYGVIAAVRRWPPGYRVEQSRVLRLRREFRIQCLR